MEQPRYGRFTHSNNALVGRMSRHLLDVGTARAIEFPFVGKPLKGFPIRHRCQVILFWFAYVLMY